MVVRKPDGLSITSHGDFKFSPNANGVGVDAGKPLIGAPAVAESAKRLTASRVASGVDDPDRSVTQREVANEHSSSHPIRRAIRTGQIRGSYGRQPWPPKWKN
jgi:hypothetical protein